jgi:hypothetical protein
MRMKRSGLNSIGSNLNSQRLAQRAEYMDVFCNPGLLSKSWDFPDFASLHLGYMAKKHVNFICVRFIDHVLCELQRKHAQVGQQWVKPYYGLTRLQLTNVSPLIDADNIKDKCPNLLNNQPQSCCGALVT